jgi:hypothetical protein
VCVRVWWMLFVRAWIFFQKSLPPRPIPTTHHFSPIIKPPQKKYTYTHTHTLIHPITHRYKTKEDQVWQQALADYLIKGGFQDQFCKSRKSKDIFFRPPHSPVTHIHTHTYKYTQIQ